MMIALAAPLSLLSPPALLYRYQQTVVLASFGGLWRFPPRNKPSNAGEEEEQEEEEGPDPESLATDRARKGGSFLTLRGMLSGSRCRNMQISSRSRLLLISDQASFLSSRASGAYVHRSPLVLASHTW
jgi:hypothetical protein